MNIWIDDWSGGGINIYRVMNGRELYDTFTSTKRLTWAEQADIASMYQEALENYGRGH